MIPLAIEPKCALAEKYAKKSTIDPGRNIKKTSIVDTTMLIPNVMKKAMI